MDVYLDLIIIENFVMNYLIIYTTAKILKCDTRFVRLFLASCVGTMFVFSLCVHIPIAILNISKFLIGLIMVKIAFGNSIRAVFKQTLIFFFVSFVYAGCALGFVHIVKPKVLYIVNGIIIGGEYIFELVLISAVVSFLLIKVSMQLIKIKQRISKKDLLCDIEIFLGERKVKIKALFDTGNLLKDNVTGCPVIVVYKERIRGLFDNRALENIDSMIGGDGPFGETATDNRIRVIPYTSVGTTSGIMLAYKVDKVKLEYQNENYEIKNVLIGFYNEALSKNDKYSALVGLQILEGSKLKSEYFKNAKSKGKYSIC